jgi:hypothetical protein
MYQVPELVAPSEAPRKGTDKDSHRTHLGGRAIFSTADGGGYWVAAANGAVANYGDAPNDGSMLGTELNGSIVATKSW